MKEKALFDMTADSVAPWLYEAVSPEGLHLFDGSNRNVSVADRRYIPEEEAVQRVAAAEQRVVSEMRRHHESQIEALREESATELKRCLDRFAEEQSRYFQRAEEEVLQLVLAIARKILQREAELDPDLLRGLVRSALDRMQLKGVARVRVPPQNASMWQADTDHPLWELILDSAVPAGECLVETEVGAASFGLAAQLATVEDALQRLMQQRPRL
jgi:flagellar biosynthesis/type III secretory pathway protein FliH